MTPSDIFGRTQTDLAKAAVPQPTAENYDKALKESLVAHGWRAQSKTLTDWWKARTVFQKSGEDVNVAVRRTNWDHVAASYPGSNTFFALLYRSPVIPILSFFLSTASGVQFSGTFEEKSRTLNLWLEDRQNTGPNALFS